MNKVLHITPEIGVISSGGIGSMCNELFEYRNEDEYFIFCNIWYEKMKESESKNLLHKDIKFSTINNFIEKINEIQPNKIIFHTMFLARYFLENNKYNITKNIWVIIHNNAFLEKSFLNTVFEGSTTYEFIFCLHNINLIVISDYEEEIIKKIIKVPDNRKIKRIYNGFKFDENFLFKDLNNFEYGYIGRLEERKGIFQLCSQFKNIDRKLFLATGKNENKNLETMLSMSISGNKNIIPVGWVTKERKKSFYEKISALIVPSIYEPFGMIFLEAANSMKNIIANKNPSSIEILGEDYPLYFTISDENSLKETINFFENLTNEEKKLIASETKNRMKSLFSIEKTIKEYRVL